MDRNSNIPWEALQGIAEASELDSKGTALVRVKIGRFDGRLGLREDGRLVLITDDHHFVEPRVER